MADEFLKLSPDDQRDTILAGAEELKKSATLIEKDIWVCWTLGVLFSMSGRKQTAFKGGTSLSKVHDLIKRFSEDIDVSIYMLESYSQDISRTQAQKAKEKIDADLHEYKNDFILPKLKSAADDAGLTLGKGDTDWEVYISYDTLLGSAGHYIKPRVKIEFGSRNEVEPSTKHHIKPYLASATKDLVFPEAADVDVLSASRTFWEKVTLIHGGLSSGELERDPNGRSRHWSDIAIIADAAMGDSIIADTALCLRVVDHRDKWFRRSGENFDGCRNKLFKIVPAGSALKAIEDDYNAMVSEGMYDDDNPPTFKEIMGKIEKLQTRLNS